MSKLLCVIIDGLRVPALACAQVACLDGLARHGVLSRQLLAPRPLLTLPALVSLFTSLPPEEHGVLSNAGQPPIASHAVSLLSLVQYRYQRNAAFYSNDRLGFLFPAGTLHTGMLINAQGICNLDLELAEEAARHLQREQPECCFLFLEGPKIAGTHFGYTSEPYLESVEQADRALGLLLEHLALVGGQQDYVLMVAGCCGSAEILDPLVPAPALPFLLSGPGIFKGKELPHPLSFLDLAPTMAAILGLAAPPGWHGRLIAEAFQDVLGKEAPPEPTGNWGGRASLKCRRTDADESLIKCSRDGNSGRS